ncbi:MAG: hypothetical protein ACLUNO_02960 [Oscillospiraceae bacterium]
MEKISRVATELGYLKDTGKVMIDISEIKRYARSQLIIVSTGSSGRDRCPRCTAWRTASHKQVTVNAGDRIHHLRPRPSRATRSHDQPHGRRAVQAGRRGHL